MKILLTTESVVLFCKTILYQSAALEGNPFSPNFWNEFVCQLLVYEG